MKKTFKIYETPVILLVQISTLIIISDIFFFILLKLIDFANRDSIILNILTAKEELMGIIMILQIFLISYLFLHWISSYYWFDKNLLLYKKGIIWTSTQEFVLSEVEASSYSQNLWEKMFNSGTIKLFFANSKFSLKKIPDPKYFLKIINNKKSQY